MRSLLLIANPAASQFTGGMHRDVMARLRNAYDVESRWPNSPEEVTDLTLDAVSRGVDLVAAMGGDGVVNRVVNGLAESKTALAIIPVGTTNVLAEIFGIPSKPKDAAEWLAASTATRPVPLARLTLDDARISWATFAVGAGFDAEVVREAERNPRRKYHFGGIHYARSAGSVLWKSFRSRLPTMRVAAGDEQFDAVSALIQIHWPYTYFGRVALTLTDRPPSTGMHVVAFERLPLHAVPRIASAAMRGRRLDKLAGTHLVDDIPTVDITAEPPAFVQADGELLGTVGHLRVESILDAMLVAAPSGVPARRRLRRKRTA